MTESTTPKARDIKTDGGNYCERVERHHIVAETVNIYEGVAKPTDLAVSNGKVAVEVKQLAFAIAGSIDEIDQAKLKAILALLQKISGDASVEIIRLESGSIKLILSGSQEGLKRIEELFCSGELTHILDTAVEYAELIEIDDKSRLVQDIRQNRASDRNLNNADLSLTNLTGADLRDANLVNADLSGANLVNTNLSRANLSGADLSGADLRNAFMRFVNLSGANLSGANMWVVSLTGADLKYANLKSADLRTANLTGANLEGANLEGANLIGVNFSGAKINQGTKIDEKWRLVLNIVNHVAEVRSLSHVDLSGANLRLSNLSSAVLRGANFRGADLSSADLSSANLRGADLSHANLKLTNLSSADLRDANLERANLIDTDISSANVENTQFRNNPGISELIKSDLIQRGAIFEDAPGDRSGVLVPH
jgi:uncharacterized protein YjbI with pentapeptide repeats